MKERCEVRVQCWTGESVPLTRCVDECGRFGGVEEDCDGKCVVICKDEEE
jgi:hypothetical protein